MPSSAYQPFWPGTIVTQAEKRVGACNYPEHWVASDVVNTANVLRGDGSGLTERRFQCPVCGRVFILEAVM